jgi:hypothetical protein
MKTRRLRGQGIAAAIANPIEKQARSATDLTPMPAAMTLAPAAGSGARTIVWSAAGDDRSNEDSA